MNPILPQVTGEGEQRRQRRRRQRRRRRHRKRLIHIPPYRETPQTSNERANGRMSERKNERKKRKNERTSERANESIEQKRKTENKELGENKERKESRCNDVAVDDRKRSNVNTVNYRLIRRLLGFCIYSYSPVIQSSVRQIFDARLLAEEVKGNNHSP